MHPDEQMQHDPLYVLGGTHAGSFPSMGPRPYLEALNVYKMFKSGDSRRQTFT